MSKQKVFLSGLIIILLIFAGPKTIQYFGYNKANGTVVKINTDVFNGLHRLHNNLGNSNQVTFNYPTVLFKDKNGNDISYSKDNEVLFGVPSLGDKVTVIYNPENPKEAWLNTFGSFWFSLPDMMIAVLCCIAWYGIVNIIFVKPRKRKTVVLKP